MTRRLKSSHSEKKRWNKPDKLMIIKDWQNHNCDIAFILNKYLISDSTFWKWRKEFGAQALTVEPSVDIAVKKQNQLAIRDTHELNLSNQKRALANVSATLLMDRLSDPLKNKYIENKDLIAIIKLAVEDEENKVNIDDALTDMLTRYEAKRKADKKESATDVEEEKE